MTAPAITVTPGPEIMSALSLMTRRRIRHLPVVEGEAADRPRLDRRPGQIPDGQDRGGSRRDAQLHSERLRQAAARAGRNRPSTSSTIGRAKANSSAGIGGRADARPAAPAARPRRSPAAAQSSAATTAAIAADAARPGATAPEQRAPADRRSPAATSRRSRRAAPPCRRARPRRGRSIPHWMPTRKASGISTAPTRPVRTARPGRPSALVAGANRICSVISGIAMASIGTSGAVSVHFGAEEGQHQRLGGHRQPEIEGQGDQHDQPHRLQEGGLDHVAAASWIRE